MTLEYEEIPEYREKYNVAWRYNNQDYTRLCDNLEEAMKIRDKIVKAKHWDDCDVTIHLIQINKFGDKVII